MLFITFNLSLIINIIQAVLYLDQEMLRFPQCYGLGNWELRVKVNKGFPTSGPFGRGCEEGLGLISTNLTCINPGAGDRQDPVPCQHRTPLKQLQVPACTTDQEPNVTPWFIYNIPRGKGRACEGLWAAGRGDERGVDRNHGAMVQTVDVQQGGWAGAFTAWKTSDWWWCRRREEKHSSVCLLACPK